VTLCCSAPRTIDRRACDRNLDRGQGAGDVSQVVDLVGKTSLGALVGVICAVSRIVSNDSGAHARGRRGRPPLRGVWPTDERATGLSARMMPTARVFAGPVYRDCPIEFTAYGNASRPIGLTACGPGGSDSAGSSMTARAGVFPIREGTMLHDPDT